jgi:hypothetical protein
MKMNLEVGDTSKVIIKVCECLHQRERRWQINNLTIYLKLLEKQE